MDDSYAVLGEDGVFAEKVDNFTVREGQREMARHVELMIEHRGTLVAESGTGTGKTFAYLVPAILQGKKTVVSTGTKYLQDQLFHRDIPRVLEVMESPLTTAMLKGRSNYLCIERMENMSNGYRRYSPALSDELISLKQWKARTKVGDISEVSVVNEKSAIWPLVTSTADNCIGKKCQHYDACFVNKARKNAQDADIVVVNHHLYFADHALKQDGFGKLLPESETYIFDEAHQLPDIASNFLGKSVSLRQITELCADVRNSEAVEKSGVKDLLLMAGDVEKTSRDVMILLVSQQGRHDWEELEKRVPDFERNLKAIAEKLAKFTDQLMEAGVAGEALTRCYERAAYLGGLLIDFCGRNDAGSVRWLEIYPKGYRIHETPLNVGSAISGTLESSKSAKIFTSATLSVDGKFDHFLGQMGLTEVDTACWHSTFNYQQQSMVYLPPGLPAPKHPSYAGELVNMMLPIVQRANGRTFMLFTSYQLMQKVHSYMKGQGFTLLMQGDKPKHELVDTFKTTERAILLGTMSFWEGVDVQGDALSCVMIDKLPFEAPNDPVLKARLRTLEEQGINPFMGYQVPRAVISLRQGAGRLIRGIDDYGVLVLCDPRVVNSRYGRVFLDSLPPMYRTNQSEDVLEFFDRRNALSL